MLLRARTVLEEHVYMDMHPCDCGEHGIAGLAHGIRARGDDLVSYFEGKCPNCGEFRRFEFAVPEEIPRNSAGSFGEGRSTIMDAGEFLEASDHSARRVVADPAGLPAKDRKVGHANLLRAIACLEEVLKFIPPEGDEVPEEDRTSQAGARIQRSLPGRFSRDRLEARHGAYLSLLRLYGDG